MANIFLVIIFFQFDFVYYKYDLEEIDNGFMQTTFPLPSPTIERSYEKLL